jgi:hypothetical protein
VADPGQRETPRQIPLIATAASRLTRSTATGVAGPSSTAATRDQA